jgi:hypothetical protein
MFDLMISKLDLVVSGEVIRSGADLGLSSERLLVEPEYV